MAKKNLELASHEHEVCNRYRDGESTTSLGKAFNVDPKTVYTLLKRNGIPIERGSHRPRKSYAKCKGCGQTKPREQMARTDASIRRFCQDCYLANRRASYTLNPVKYRNLSNQYRAENIDKCREQGRKTYWANPDTRRQATRQSYHKKPEHYRAMRLERWHSMTLQQKEHYRESQRDNRADAASRRRARLRGNGPIVKIDRQRIIERDKSICYLCGKLLPPGEITLDHVVPVSRGGPHIPENLKVACQPCNSRKHNRLLEEFVI